MMQIFVIRTDKTHNEEDSKEILVSKFDACCFHVAAMWVQHFVIGIQPGKSS